MRESFVEALAGRVLVGDGAMGTVLYARGVYINQCYDEVNLARPELVAEIHGEYLAAGADFIETNTFGANPLKLRPHGLAERSEEINRRGAQLARAAVDAAGRPAWVAGSIGPLGERLSPIGKIAADEAVELFRPQVRGLLAGGVDLLIVETVADLVELEAAVRCVRELCDLPVVASATFAAEGRTVYGYTPGEVLRAMAAVGVAAVGANCAEGPHDMLDTIARLRAADAALPLAAMPNAGSPRKHDDRFLYMSSPEYLAEYARRFIHAGATIVGGCCGTTPAHIRAIRAMVRSLEPAEAKARAPSKTSEAITAEPLERGERRPAVSVEQRSPLGAKLARKSVLGHRFVCSVELSPPRGHDPARVLAAAEQLKFQGVDVVNIPDGPRASARMSALHTALLIEQQVGMETILHVCCRDRNLLGMQSDLLGAAALGLRNILAITGDPPKLGDYPEVTAVYDVESIGLVRVLQGLNEGVDLAANPIQEQTRFLIGVGANPGAEDLERELRRFRYKVEAGANFCMTQPVYEPALLERFLDAITAAGCRVPVLVGILPLASHRNAEFLHNEVPGMQIPQPIRDRMRAADSGEQARAAGIEIAQQALDACRHLVEGVYVMPPFGRVDAAVRVLEVLR